MGINYDDAGTELPLPIVPIVTQVLSSRITITS